MFCATALMRKRATKLNEAAAGARRTSVFTIGHSTRPIEEFIPLLKAHGIEEITDVRTIPRSRHNPQFNSEVLRKSLKKAQISYIHLPGLGGLRHTSRASINKAWRNASFRGYADYMQTPEFEKSLRQFLRLAKKRQSALMCAEAVPWRCHRWLLADALLVRGFPVEHIISATTRQPHQLTPFAKVQGYRVTYPADASSACVLDLRPSPIKVPRKTLKRNSLKT
jgi:uncharacterized protein (DUF488 family)